MYIQFYAAAGDRLYRRQLDHLRPSLHMWLASYGLGSPPLRSSARLQWEPLSQSHASPCPEQAWAPGSGVAKHYR